MKKGSLAHDKTLFGRHFCCLVIYATLHSLPCVCIIMAPAGTFFTSLLVAGNKIEKRKLRTWQSIVWKAFLLFGDMRYIIFTICRAYASKWLRRVFFSLFL